MSRSWFKQALWGNSAGTPAERRVYITVTIVLWLAVLVLHEPVPGLAFDPAGWIRFSGGVLFLWAFFSFFEGVTMDVVDGLLGVPGSVGAYSHGPETTLFTEGAYARVRHPQYRVYPGLARFVADASEHGPVVLGARPVRDVSRFYTGRRSPASQGPRRGLPPLRRAHAVAAVSRAGSKDG